MIGCGRGIGGEREKLALNGDPSAFQASIELSVAI